MSLRCDYRIDTEISQVEFTGRTLGMAEVAGGKGESWSRPSGTRGQSRKVTKDLRPGLWMSPLRGWNAYELRAFKSSSDEIG